ncbi:hypothetical protein [Rhodopseudomonas palustris]|uniref:hypothetical protein n=1 Tax=Rhodopseudomonas palustris TaxID=1076 RepID=UPI0011B043DE|nr:hypothetical protein [Rhodopseudomonas palustris]
MRFLRPDLIRRASLSFLSLICRGAMLPQRIGARRYVRTPREAAADLRDGNTSDRRSPIVASAASRRTTCILDETTTATFDGAVTGAERAVTNSERVAQIRPIISYAIFRSRSRFLDADTATRVIEINHFAPH